MLLLLIGWQDLYCSRWQPGAIATTRISWGPLLLLLHGWPTVQGTYLTTRAHFTARGTIMLCILLFLGV